MPIICAFTVKTQVHFVMCMSNIQNGLIYYFCIFYVLQEGVKIPYIRITFSLKAEKGGPTLRFLRFLSPLLSAFLLFN